MRRDLSASPQPVLLGLLATRPLHGYELYQEYSRELGSVWAIGLSQLYAQLKLLEEAGLVSSETEVQPNRPPRKIYHLTAEGQAVFAEWIYQPSPSLRNMRVEFLARLYFFQRLSLPGFEQLVAEQKALCHNQAERYGRQAAATDDSFRELVLEFRRGQLEAACRWLDQCLARKG
jgi:DNA-binding PadR family transcriptional regulator